MNHFYNSECVDLIIKALNKLLDLLVRVIVFVVVLVAGYIIYDGTRVTTSVILGKEVLDLAPTDDENNSKNLQALNADIVG